MTAAADEAVVYHEPAGSYVSSFVMFFVVVAGFVIDCIASGRIAHVLGWSIALVGVVGVNVLVTTAARSLRSITVTGTQLRVGDDVVDRSSIVAVDQDNTHVSQVLGQTMHTGLPRGLPGLALQLVDGTVVAVPTRFPDRLVEALAIAAEPDEVRPLEPDDLPMLADIGNRTSALFRVAGIELPPEWASVARRDSSIAIFVIGRPAEGFIRLAELDGQAHIAALAVVPGVMRRGVGSSLLEAACDWAAREGYASMTVSTYVNVPWNAPFFLSRGFTELDELGPQLTALRKWEGDVGLDRPGPRIVLQRTLTATPF